MPNIDKAFVSAGLIFLVLGQMLGLYIGAASRNDLLQIHIALVLPGFVVLTLYGLLFRNWPALKSSPLARPIYWSGVIGALGLILGTSVLALSDGTIVWPIAIASVLAIASSLLMAALFTGKTE